LVERPEHWLGGVTQSLSNRQDARVATRDMDVPARVFDVVWEWLVAHVWWTSAAFATLLAVFTDDLDPSEPLGWVIFALMLVLLWVPAGARMRRIYLRAYHRP